jgi:hypothetical protein
MQAIGSVCTSVPREDRRASGSLFLGPARFASVVGEPPMGITRRLDVRLPDNVFVRRDDPHVFLPRPSTIHRAALPNAWSALAASSSAGPASSVSVVLVALLALQRPSGSLSQAPTRAPKAAFAPYPSNRTANVSSPPGQTLFV